MFCMLICLILLLAGCQKAPVPDSRQARRPTVIAAIGDSITWGALAFGAKAASGGYPMILETTLREAGYDVVVFNKGIPGEKAFQTHARFADAIADADIALLMIGTNDIIRPESCPQPQQCRTVEHIAVMLEEAQRAGVRVLVSTILPAQPHCDRSWANPPIQEVNERIRALAQQTGVPLVDSSQAILDHGNGALFSDCLHLTDVGYAILAEHWYDALLARQILTLQTTSH